MKPRFSLGLLLPLSIGVSGISNPFPFELDENSMGVVANAAGMVLAVDPDFICQVDYTLTVDCKF